MPTGLRTFGFRKVAESEQECEYANDDFVRGKPELTLDIEITRLKSFVTGQPFMFEGILPGLVSPETMIAYFMAIKEKLKTALAKDISKPLYELLVFLYFIFGLIIYFLVVVLLLD